MPQRPPQRFFQGGFKQNPFVVEIPKPEVNVSKSSLQDSHKEVIYGIIQRDADTELAFCLDEWGNTFIHADVPVDAEIQNPGSYWTLMHLCSRWNAVKCLSFVLRSYYEEHPTDYVKFVNTQTVEGYTPIMLTVIWGAQECFDLLIDFGGCDLSLRDARGADIFHHAFSYRREKMQKILNGFKQNNVVVFAVRTQALSKTVNLDAMLVEEEDAEDDVQTSKPRKNNQLQQQLQNFRLRQEQTLRKNQEQLAQLAETHRKEQERLAQERKRIADQQQKLREDAVANMKAEMERVRQEWMRRQQQQMQQFLQQQQAQQQQLQMQMQQQQMQQQQRAEQERLMREQQEREKQAYQQQLLQQQMQQQAALQQKKKMEEQALKQKIEEQRVLEEQRKAYELQVQRKQEQFIEQQRQIQKQKEDELKRIVEEQKKAEEERILQEQRANEQKKLDEQKQLQAKLQEDDMQRRIAEQRELLKKSLEEQKRKAEQNSGPQQTVVEIKNTAQTSMVCPADVKPLYDQVLARKVNFVDDKFPPKLSTIGDNSKLDSDMRSSLWLRPGQIFNQNYELFDGIDPDDIKQGSLGVCYYLSTLSALAEKENRIRSLFPFYNKELGFYVVKLNIHGKPTNIVVDDFMPCFRGTNEPMFTKPNGNEIWVMVLEKAWVKNFGSYLGAEAMSPDTMMEDVDGAPAKGVWIEDSAKEFNNLLNYDNLNYIIVLTSLSDKVPKGIVSGHAYSLLQVYNVKGVKLYKIRNPWGSFEWDGAYSSNSRKWTQELKQAVGYLDADDGIFYMTPEELTLGFNYYSVGMIKENFLYSYLQFTSEPLEDLYFSFSVKKKGEVNLRLIQKFDRFMNDPNYAYSPLIFEVGRITGPESAIFMGEGSDNTVFGDKSVHHHEDVYQTFEPGNYFVRVRMIWKKNIRTAVLVGYAAEQLTFTRMNGDEGLKNWKNMMRNVLSTQQKEEVVAGISYVQTWMKGQYIFYAENSSNRDYEFTVKFAPKEFVNCRLGLKRTSEADMKFTMRAKNGSNIGTIEKIELEKECEIGSIGFLAKPL